MRIPSLLVEAFEDTERGPAAIFWWEKQSLTKLTRSRPRRNVFQLSECLGVTSPRYKERSCSGNVTCVHIRTARPPPCSSFVVNMAAVLYGSLLPPAGVTKSYVTQSYAILSYILIEITVVIVHKSRMTTHLSIAGVVHRRIRLKCLRIRHRSKRRRGNRNCDVIYGKIQNF